MNSHTGEEESERYDAVSVGFLAPEAALIPTFCSF